MPKEKPETQNLNNNLKRLSEITKWFENQEEINVEEGLKKIKEATITLGLLQEKGLIKDKDKLVKILGKGELKEPVTIAAHAFSKRASEVIRNAGGKIEIINV